MKRAVRIFLSFVLLTVFFGGTAALAAEPEGVPVILYHRFGPTVADSMTTKTEVFAAQMKWLKDNGYTVIPMRHLVNYLLGQGPPPPPKSVVLCTDDGHKSVYSDMLPIVKKYNYPVTLFIYPSCISNKHAPYAMTWEQLGELQKTGLFDIQSHTLWHPNFKKDKKKLTPAAYQKEVDEQLVKSKAILEKKMGTKVDLLAWPFGIYDPDLEKEASKAGYVAAFSINRRFANKSEPIMAQPRYLMANSDGVKGFAAIVEGKVQEKGQKTY
jgi:peptidoglycan/xylan/chitin deacetylase (PgdA/CDA1 family)|uniref:Polysaccharide deacetylase family protein n=1 Tax=Desulfobacca acetoxidans TaxID=60893 RepID=A0A7V6A2F4_9BACT